MAADSRSNNPRRGGDCFVGDILFALAVSKRRGINDNRSVKSAPTLINVRNVSKSFAPASQSRRHRLAAIWHVLRRQADPDAIEVLRDLSLTVQKGHSVGLIGRNGAGKSTLLKLICGVLKPTTGRIDTRGRIGALLELGAGFNPIFSGRDNLILAGTLSGMPPREIRDKLDQMIEFADIGHYIDEPVKHYSSGMVVRLGFALITASKPDILITDEVLGVGDESFQRKCRRWVNGYLQQGGTLLVVSHSMDELRRLCPTSYWIEEGQIRMAGNTDEVASAYLRWQDERIAQGQAEHNADGSLYQIKRLTLNDSEQAITLEPGAGLRVTADVFSPDDRVPTLAIGVKDRQGTPIFGTTSEMDSAEPQKLAPYRYRFELNFPSIPLVPGAYAINGHAMDPEGLRLFDTVIRDFTVAGEPTLLPGLVPLG